MENTCKIKIKLWFNIEGNRTNSIQFVIDVDKSEWMEITSIEEKLEYLAVYMEENVETTCKYEVLGDGTKLNWFEKTLNYIKGCIV